MLRGISWGQFGIFLLLVAAVYYLFLFISIYKADALHGSARRDGPEGEADAGAEKGSGEEDY